MDLFYAGAEAQFVDSAGRLIVRYRTDPVVDIRAAFPVPNFGRSFISANRVGSGWSRLNGDLWDLAVVSLRYAD